MKILQVVHGFPPKQRAGTEVLTYNLSKELAKNHEVHVFYPVYQKEKTHEKIISFKKDGIIHHQVIKIDNLLSNTWKILQFNPVMVAYRDVKIEKKFEELLDEIDPDIVHFQHLAGLSVVLPLIAKEYSSVVLTLNDYWLVCPTTHFLDAEGRICTRSSPERCSRCVSKTLLKMIFKKLGHPQLDSNILAKTLEEAYGIYGKNKIRKRILTIKKVIKTSDKIIAPSRTIIEKFTENDFINSQDLKKVLLLHHGVDVANLRKVQKKPYNKIRFGFVGFMSERKGVHVLIQAFKKLNDPNAELRIYGHLDLGNKYHRYILKESRGHDIRFMGSFDNIKEPYSHIDVLVVPSVTYEGYGLVVQEAFATGTPVIASNIGALNEFVEHMKNGLLFKIGDPDDLARKMRIILENPGLLIYLRKNLPPVKSIQQYTRELEKIYKNMIK